MNLKSAKFAKVAAFKTPKAPKLVKPIPFKEPKITLPKQPKQLKPPTTHTKVKTPLSLPPGSYLGRKLGKAFEGTGYQEKYDPEAHWMGK